MPIIDTVEILPVGRTPTQAVALHISQATGEALDTRSLNRDLLRIYGEGHYQSVDYQLVSLRDRKILRITPIEKPWGPDYLRFALNVNSEMQHGSSYTLRGSYQRTGLNALGAESLLSAELGNQTNLMASFYQPLNSTQRWFVEPVVRVANTSAPIYQSGTRIAEYSLRTLTTELAAGINLGRYGQAKLGLTSLSGKATRDTGQAALPESSDSLRGWFVSLDIDRFDHLYFPKHGWSTQFRYANYPESNNDKLSTSLRAAFPLGRYVGNMALSYAGSHKGKAPTFDASSLGGFMNLSAYGRGRFVGDQIFYGRIGLEQILGSAPLGLQGDLRLGLAWEGARIGQRLTETQGSGPLHSLLVYVGGETPLGPVYLGLGMARGASNMYLSLGIR